jgi:hypothetical protein
VAGGRTGLTARPRILILCERMPRRCLLMTRGVPGSVGARDPARSSMSTNLGRSGYARTWSP